MHGTAEGSREREVLMLARLSAGIATLCLLSTPLLAQGAAKPTDPQIAHIAYTAGQLDIAAAKQALARSHNAQVRGFATEMVRDHQAVNDKALALVKKLHVTPEANATSASLSKQADATLKRLAKLHGRTFDRAYVDNEVAYHRTVNGALKTTLIPSATNAQLKSLLETGLTLFTEHQKHAEQLAAKLK
jgi:putative membrane protein